MYPSDELRERLREVEPYPPNVCAVPKNLRLPRFFVERCRAFFRVQLSVCQPRLVLALGVDVPPFLAPLSQELNTKWRGEKKPLTFAQIDGNGGGLIQTSVRDVEGQERELTFVALTHPAQQWPNVWRRRWGELESYQAEEALLRAGVERSGIKL